MKKTVAAECLMHAGRTWCWLRRQCDVGPTWQLVLAFCKQVATLSSVGSWRTPRMLCLCLTALQWHQVISVFISLLILALLTGYRWRSWHNEVLPPDVILLMKKGFCPVIDYPGWALGGLRGSPVNRGPVWKMIIKLVYVIHMRVCTYPCVSEWI